MRRSELAAKANILGGMRKGEDEVGGECEELVYRDRGIEN